MKLLVVSTWLPYPPDNGSRMRAYSLLRHLSRRHTITLLSFATRGCAADPAPLHALCERVEVVAPTGSGGGRLGRRGLLSRTPRHFVSTDSPEMRSLVARHVAGQAAAIGLQVDAARYLEPYPTVPRVFEEVEVAVYRERYLREPRRTRRLRAGLTWWKYSRFVRRLVDGFGRATVVSEQERDHLREIGCDIARVAVVPNGIEVPDATPRVVRAARLIYPGAVTYSANLDAVRYFVDEIYPLVRRTRPELEFWITGSTEGVDISPLQQPGVRFTGWLPDVDRLVAESEACVVPLRVGGGTRVKVLQSMALATPVVSTSKGVEGLEVEPGRHVLVADTPRQFAQQLAKLSAEEGLGDRLAEEAYSLVRERYAWEPIAGALERVIESAVASQGSPGKAHSLPRSVPTSRGPISRSDHDVGGCCGR